MTLNGYAITGEGETCPMEMAAQDAGTPLPSRPERARANDAAAWKPPTDPANNSDAGQVNMKAPSVGHNSVAGQDTYS